MTARQDLGLLQHPLSAAFPSMAEGEIEALAIDIEKHGQREPGMTLDGMVLDGWHRYLACQKAGREFVSVKFTGADPVGFVISKNLHRRHLTASQRAAAVVSASKWRPSGVTRAAAAAALTETNKSLAAKAEVGERTIRQAKVAEKAGLGDAVRDGQLSAEQASQLSKGKPGKSIKPKAADPLLQKAYDALQTEFSETKEALAEMTDLAASATAFKNKEEFKAMQDLRAELRAVKQRRGELMRENAELKKDLAYWKKKAK